MKFLDSEGTGDLEEVRVERAMVVSETPIFWWCTGSMVLSDLLEDPESVFNSDRDVRSTV